MVKKIIFLTVTTILLLGGIISGYLFLLVNSPSMISSPEIIVSNPQTGLMQKVSKDSTAFDQSWSALRIPKIGLDLKVGNGVEALEKDAWHRFPERGNPEIGGNFILTAHRFQFASTPAEVVEGSPLYRVRELAAGDKILISWRYRQYEYRVEKVFEVAPTAVEIEDQSENAKLTLYTCDEEGHDSGRIVVIAKPVGN